MSWLCQRSAASRLSFTAADGESSARPRSRHRGGRIPEKRMQAGLQKIPGCGGRLGPALRPGRLHLRIRKVDAHGVLGLVQTVGGEQYPISRRELDDVLVV